MVSGLVVQLSVHRYLAVIRMSLLHPILKKIMRGERRSVEVVMKLMSFRFVNLE